MNDYPIMEPVSQNVVLFHPHIPAGACERIEEVLRSRWIGQGPRVEEYERLFASKFAPSRIAIAVGSGTDALHLAYILAGLRAGDEVITPLFTCTATNIPLLYMGVKVVFADVDVRSMNISPADVRRHITPRTKAIICVHYGGLPCDMAELDQIASEHNLIVIEDAAHALGASYRGKPTGELADMAAFSFQAVKQLTTGDGGVLTVRDQSVANQAKRLRWFGIDREAKQMGIWENDIREVGYKYQMTDLSAALGLAGLEEFDSVMKHRQSLFKLYESLLSGIAGIDMVGVGYQDRVHASWLCTVLVENRVALQKKLRESGIESAQVHYRNDRYSVFGGRQECFPNMDYVEDRYLVLPLHTRMNCDHVERICTEIRTGW